MKLSNRTIGLLAQPFEGGEGPSHSVIELIWESAGAFDYLGEGNKLERVLSGLRSLQSGRRATAGQAALPPDPVKLQEVASGLASRLMASDLVDVDELHQAMEQDGFAIFEGEVATVRPLDEPVDRLTAYVSDLFEERPELDIAVNHYEQATRAFNRRDWEAANAQFRSAFDATYDALAASRGCPKKIKGGRARRWLQDQGLVGEDEAQMLQAFAKFAGRDGSHAGISAASDAQLRRHFATALIAFGIAKVK